MITYWIRQQKKILIFGGEEDLWHWVSFCSNNSLVYFIFQTCHRICRSQFESGFGFHSQIAYNGYFISHGHIIIITFMEICKQNFKSDNLILKVVRQ